MGDWGELLLILKSCPQLQALSLDGTKLNSYTLVRQRDEDAAASLNSNVCLVASSRGLTRDLRLSSPLCTSLDECVSEDGDTLAFREAFKESPSVYDSRCMSLKELCLDSTGVTWTEVRPPGVRVSDPHFLDSAAHSTGIPPSVVKSV